LEELLDDQLGRSLEHGRARCDPNQGCEFHARYVRERQS